MLDKYVKYTDTIDKINKQLKNKKIRMPNFPSEISENIAKYAIYKKYNIYPSWDTKVGDLIINNKYICKKLEIKWDYIYFVDATKYRKQHFIVYEIKLSNDSAIFSNIKLNKNETYKNQCDQKRRPRICFNELQKQLNKYINVIFNGTINCLFQ